MDIQKARDLFNELQDKSENFEYGQVYSLEDFHKDIFTENKLFINRNNEVQFDNRFYYSNTFDYLAQSKEYNNDAELFQATRDTFSKKYNGQFTEAMGVKDHLVGYLDNNLHPKYFSDVNHIKTHYLHSKYSESLFKEHSENIISALSCFYTGNYDRIKSNLSEFIIGQEYYLEIQHQHLEDTLESALSKLLSIQEASHKVMVLLQFPENTIYVNREIENRIEAFWDKEPIRENNTANIPEYIERAIREVAFEKSKAPNSHAYQTMVGALTLYHSTEMDGKKVSKEMDIKPNTFSGWKTSVEEKLN
jgi:hypothetical protein